MARPKRETERELAIPSRSTSTKRAKHVATPEADTVPTTAATPTTTALVPTTQATPDDGLPTWETVVQEAQALDSADVTSDEFPRLVSRTAALPPGWDSGHGTFARE